MIHYTIIVKWGPVTDAFMRDSKEYKIMFLQDILNALTFNLILFNLSRALIN